MSLNTMTPHEYAGAVNRASQVFVYIAYGAPKEEGTVEGEGMFLPIPKSVARTIKMDAKECETDIEAYEADGCLYVGCEPA